MMYRHVRAFFALSALACWCGTVGAGAAMAQSASLGAVVSTSDHQLLGDPLLGAALQVRFPRHNSVVAFRIGAEWVRGQAERVGSPCAGLVQPGTCAPEPLRDNGRLISTTGGAVIRALSARRFALSLTGDLRIAGVHADTRGLASGRTLSASKLLWGALVGLESAWMPTTRAPIAVELGGALGVLMPQSESMVVDGYTPFEDDFSLDMLRLAIVWRIAP